MKRILLSISAIIFFIQYGFGQVPNWQWADGFGGTGDDVGLAITLDTYNNIYSTGYFKGTVDFDPGPGIFNLTGNGEEIYIVKLNSSGQLIWAKSIGSFGNDRGSSMTLDSDANIYITGSFAYSVDFDPDTGNFTLTSSGSNSDAFVLKLDSAGHFIWAKRFGGSGNEAAISIVLDSSRNVYSTGTFQTTADFDPGAAIYNLTSAGNLDIYVSRLDSSGNFNWAGRLGGGNIDEVMGMVIDEFGNLYTTGGYRDIADFDPGPGTFNFTAATSNKDIFISKLNSSGNFVWAKSINGPANDYGFAISYDFSGNGAVYITGPFSGTLDFDPGSGVSNLSPIGGTNIFILKLDTAGNFLWAKRVGGISTDISYHIMTDSGGNSYTTGWFSSSVVDFDPDSAGVYNLTNRGVFVLKLDNNGIFQWAIEPIGCTTTDRGNALFVDAYGYVYLTGYFRCDTLAFGSTTLINAGGLATPTDIFIAKIDTSFPTKTIELQELQNIISIFPNPAQNTFTISLNVESGITNWELGIYDIMGRKVHEQTVNGKQETVNRKLSSGIYFVSVKTEKGISSAKFVKE